MFANYREALLDRDFATACTLTAPETDRALIANLKKLKITVATCEAGFRWIYSPTRQGGAAAKLADEITRTTRVSKITVTGQSATIVWSAKLDGRRVTVSHTARRIGGQWQLVDVD